MSASERCCILLVQRVGKKKEKSLLKSSVSNIDVLPGTLLVLLEVARRSTTSPPCYVLETIDSESILVQCHSLDDFQEISPQVFDLLVTVPTCQDRLTLFHNKAWLNEGLDLAVGDPVDVWVKSRQEDLFGIVRFKGKVLEWKGIMFGVELVENPGAGTSDGTFRKRRYFTCPPDSAVFVGIHKLRKSKERWHKDTHKHMPEGAEAAGGYSPEGKSQLQSNLRVGDRIIWVSDIGPEPGVVKWIGPLPDARSREEITVGVEFDRAVGSGTGKYKDQRLFNARQGHASLVPILGLMKENEFYNGPDIKSDPIAPELTALANESGSGNKTQKEVIEEQQRMIDECKHQRMKDESKQQVQGVKLKDISNVQVQSSKQYPSEMSPLYVNTDVKANVASNTKANVALNTKLTKLSEGNIAQPVQQTSDSEDLKVRNLNPMYLLKTKEVTGELIADEAMEMQSHGSQGQSRPSKKSIPSADPELEVGSLVEVMSSKPLYGIIKWIGNLPDQKEPRKLIAGLEMEEEVSAGTDGTFASHRLFLCAPKKGFFVPLYKCRKDRRFQDDSRRSRTDANFGSIETPDLLGTVPPPDLSGSILSICGKNKGIQGHHNSCYLDATLLAMFYFTPVFDSILHRPRNERDLPEYDEVKQVLKEGIVNPLRRYHYVRADKVMKLRRLLDKLGNISGMMSEEKDPEEFLNLLLNQITKAEPFLHISAGDIGDSQHTYFYQLIMEKDELLVLPTTQQLFELSFLQMGIKLQEVPSCLIVQMPRFGKDYKMYKRIMPSLELDITDVLEYAPRECIICGELAMFECKECYQVHGAGLNTIAFCEGCKKTSHQHKLRKQHKPRQISVPQGFKDYYEYHKSTGQAVTIPREKMELFAVICIQTSHYVSFVKSGNGKDAQWIFFDSMADRMGEQSGYNIPEVTSCPDLPMWLSDEHHNEIINAPDRELPEHMRRLICDAYICLYQSPNVMMFK